jgi:hypothetical protein
LLCRLPPIFGQLRKRIGPHSCRSEPGHEEWNCIGTDVYVIERYMTIRRSTAAKLDERLASEAKNVSRD